MNQATQYLNSAATAVVGKRSLVTRVQRDSLPLNQAWVLRYPTLKQEQVIKNLPFYGPSDQITGCNSFISTARTYNTNQISYSESFASYATRLPTLCRPAATMPAECQGLTNWIDVPNNMFSLVGGIYSMIVDDSAASTGKAAKMVSANYNWSVQYRVSPLIANAGKWHCYARVRVDCNGTTGNAFTVGIWNGSGSGSPVIKLAPKLQDGAKDGLYHTYDLGVQTLTTSMYFWFAPPDDPVVVPYVYMDRIFMIRAD